MNGRLFHIPVLKVAVLVTLTLLTGCQAGRANLEGRRIPQKNLHPIQTAVSASPDLWKGLHMDVRYRTEKEEDTLLIEGQMLLGGGLQHFSLIDTLKLELFLADSEGRLLGRHRLYWAGFRTSMEFSDFGFNRRVPLPPGATHLSFGYDGKVIEGGFGMGKDGDGGTDYTFWYSPFWEKVGF